MMVSSAQAGEGKTVTSLNLAIVLASRKNFKTIVVDGDLRKNRVATLLNNQGRPGLADALRGKASLKEIIHPTVYPNLSFIPAQKTSSDESAELLGRAEMEDIITSLRKNYDYVIIDSPPLNVVSDGSILAQSVREALIVVRMNRTRRESINKAVKQLTSVNVKVVGFVLTHQKYYIPNYLYRYS